jgi:Na+-transporting NADH:ubiquinone oxidoreductase subunit C
MRTIRGITFYEQEETPGLGGEIDSESFRKQFEGKKIVDETGRAGIVISGGGQKHAVNEVDAITGATMTCEKVEAILNTVIERIVKESGKDGE